MKLSDILKLNNEIESLNIIQAFLNQPISQYEYESAVAHYLKIAIHNNLNELVLNEGQKHLDKVSNQTPSKYREVILGYLVDAAIAESKFELANRYIKERKELLPIVRGYIALLDQLKYKKAMNEDCYDILKKLSVEVLPNDVKISVNEELLDYYLEREKLEKALLVLLELKENTLKDAYDLKLLEIYYKQNDFKNLTELAQTLVENSKNVYAAVYLIISLTQQSKYIKASSYEAEYEKLIDGLEDENFKEFAYEKIIDLYKLINNNFSQEVYDRKLKKLKKRKVTIKNEEKITPAEKVEIKEVVTTKVLSSAKYLEHFEWIRLWMERSHLIESKIAFREYLREIFNLINEKIQFSEVILYVNKYYESNFFNYKKERLYDKKIIQQYLDDTVMSLTLSQQDNVFGAPQNLLSQKDVLTQKNYSEETKFVFSFYLDKEMVLTFYFNEEVTDPSIYYELLSGIALIIKMRILDDINIRHLKNEAKYASDIIKNPIMPMRILKEFKSEYNESAVKLFKIDSKYHLELFLREMPLNEADSYQNAINRLFNYPNESKILEYSFQDLKICEYLFAAKVEGVVTIFSFFVDVTAQNQKEEILSLEATVDSETGLKNKNALSNEICNYLQDKATFVLIELNQDLRAIYGNERINHHFIELARSTAKHFINHQVYRYDFNQLLIVFNFNDIRTVNKEIADYFQVINHLKSQVLKYEKFKVKAGILRYPVVTIEKNVDKLYRYLDVALEKSKSNKEQDYTHFIFADYEKEVFEQEVIDYLNTAIENHQLHIRFKQIIDLRSNIVWNYESEIYLPTINIDSKYLHTIAHKRKKIVELEQFHIELVCSFLSKLENETNHLIKLTIPISQETFLNTEFQSFLVATLKRYKVPAEFIRILCDIDIKDQTSALKVQELSKIGISIDTTYIETALSNEFHAVHLKYNKSNIKWRNYYKVMHDFLMNNNIALVIKGIDSKEERDVIKNLGLFYIEGSLYQKINPDDIIAKVKERIE